MLRSLILLLWLVSGLAASIKTNPCGRCETIYCAEGNCNSYRCRQCYISASGCKACRVSRCYPEACSFACCEVTQCLTTRRCCK